GDPSGEFSAEELVRMARQNAQRLHRTLLTLLDLAAVESGTFHVRLREIDLLKLVSGRIEAHVSLFKDRGLPVRKTGVPGSPVLADPQKIARVVDLCFHILISRVEPSTPIQVTVQAAHVQIEFTLASGTESNWEKAWTQALAGHQGGVTSPTSAFSGVLQSEQAFLTRTEEGLGSEFLLIHEIIRQHKGKFFAIREGRAVTLTFELPELTSEGALQSVLSSRAYDASNELRSVTLILVGTPAGAENLAKRVMDAHHLAKLIKPCLFRASDAVYALPDLGKVALVLDDCKPEYVSPLLTRIEKALGMQVLSGIAHCPVDGHDPVRLLELAKKRLATTGAVRSEPRQEK
ncbi:MAG TPA: hypothetical protein VM598_09540, partial [Bdellovibrionota bacterium]|nr:hypothetical protein [Bdellovibrionota bacterium]